MLRYCFILAVAVALIFAGSTTAWAQGNTDYCELLSAEDCELLHDSAQAMRDVTSIETQVNVDMLVKNILEVPFEELSINVTQHTAFALDDNAAQILADLRQMSPDDMTFLFQRTEEVFNLYFDVLTGSSFDSELTISVSEEVAQIISEEADAGFDLPSSIEFGARLLDGIMYINLSSFADALPGIRTTGDMWLGFEFASVLDLAAADADFGEIGEDEAAALAQFASGLGGVAGGPLITTLGATEMTELLLPYVDVERLPDDELDGNGVAVFRTVIDYQYLSGDPIFQSLLAELLGDESLIGIHLSDLEIEQIVDMAEIFGPDLLESLGMELIEMIDLETNHLLSSQVGLNWDISQLAALASLAAAGVGLDSDELPIVFMDISTVNDSINEDIIVDEPVPAMIFATQEIIDLVDLP